MLFLNLNKLKIEKSYNYQTFIADMEFPDFSAPLRTIKDAGKNAVQKVLSNKQSIEGCYEIHIGEPNLAAADPSEAEDFLSLVNIIVAEFFSAIVTDQGWKRERRLDVPEELKVAKMSLSLLKRAVNHKTTIDNFNLVIKYKDLTFVLIDEKEDK